MDRKKNTGGYSGDDTISSADDDYGYSTDTWNTHPEPAESASAVNFRQEDPAKRYAARLGSRAIRGDYNNQADKSLRDASDTNERKKFLDKFK